jgi:hypothetical protein
MVRNLGLALENSLFVTMFIEKSFILHNFPLRFGLSDKHTRFEKFFLKYGLDKSADLLSKRQNHEEDFFKLCALLKKSTLYQY